MRFFVIYDAKKEPIGDRSGKQTMIESSPGSLKGPDARLLEHFALPA